MSDPSISDGFDSIRDPTLCTNPGAFLTLYRHGASKAKSVSDAMNRFLVRSVTIDKHVDIASQHEYLAVVARDAKGQSDLLLFIERVPGNSSTNDVRARQLGTSPSTERLISSPSVEHPTPSNDSLLEPLAPVVLRKKPSRTILEKASLTVIQGMHSTSASLMEVTEAEDRILGSSYVKRASYGSGRVVSEINIGYFSLFDLALLADVVHNVSPKYSLFKTHCYWFTKIMCDAVEQLSNNVDPDNCFGSHLPALSGTWNGVLVNDVENNALEDVLNEFRKRRRHEMEEVRKTETFFPSIY
jgi:hypothetical protein